jgi:hypothetical protein
VHYNEIFTRFWQQHGRPVVYRPSCLRRPYVNLYWNIDYPEVCWTDDTVVVLHCQDFLSIHDHGCAELYNIERHYGDRSRQVVVIHWNYDLYRAYQGPLNLIYFPTHTYEILTNLGSERFREWRQKPLAQRTRTWQCLNGIPRPHRRCVHNWLRSWPNGITSLGKIDPLPQDSYHDTYTWTGDPMINENNLVRLAWLYDHTWINVVTETQYTESPGIISEKTLFALLSRQIPIMIGYRGIVEDCKSLGFDMFDDVVDHGYDDLDDGYRWRRALELNESLLRGEADFQDLVPRLERQRDWCLDTWPKIMIQEHDRRCAEILENLTKQ